MAVRRKYKSFSGEWFALSDLSDSLDPYALREATSEAAADTLLCLSNQAIFLRKRQFENQEQEFVEEGGFTEKLYWIRKKARDKKNLP